MSRLGPYEIQGELGRGAMGVVYRALDPVIGRTVAIKTIHVSALGGDERSELQERLIREARSAGILSHPHIVTIYHIGNQDEWAYIVMECVDGPTLGQVMELHGRLPVDRMLPILRQTASGLDYAHRHGVVHRDVKPANIMLTTHGEVKITDFGVARLSSQTITRTGIAMGTPAYMSSEQVQGKGVDGRADQYSLAVIAYQLLTGAKPFDADTITALLFKIVYEDAPSPQSVNPSLSPAVEPVLRQALSKNASERFASCGEFVDALERVMAPVASKPALTTSSSISTSTSTTSQRPALPTRLGRKPLTWAVAGTVGVAAFIVLGYATVSRTRSTSVTPEQSRVTQASSATGPTAATGATASTGSSGSQPGGQPVAPTEPAEPPRQETLTVTGAEQPLTVAGTVQIKKLVKRVAPVYPPLARTARIEGEVLLTIVVARDGTVKSVEALHGHPYLIPAAINAARQWVYQPTLLAGRRVEVETDIAVVFRLTRE